MTDVMDLIDKIDIVEYIGQYVSLELRGEEYWGLSPFTNEKTPSFSVREETKRFYDFSSGFGGNVVHFTEKYFSIGFIEAMKRLEKYAGIEDGNDTPSDVPKRLECTKFAKRFVQHEKKTYSENKPLEDDCMEKFETDSPYLELWRKEGITDESMRYYGVRFDSFSQRIVFPVRNPSGKVINICGRTVDKDFKEKNIRKYTYLGNFSGGTIDTVYGLSDAIEEIKKKNEIILFEGCKSVLLAYGWGIRNTGAILTSHLNPKQVEILAKLGVNTVFALDKEIDVSKDKNVQRLSHLTNVFVMRDFSDRLDEKMSPTDKGFDIFKAIYGERRRFF